MNQPFDPNQVQIPVTLNLAQVNTILEGLGELPFKKVEGIYNGLREVALNTLKQAEAVRNAPEPVEVAETTVEEARQEE